MAASARVNASVVLFSRKGVRSFSVSLFTWGSVDCTDIIFVQMTLSHCFKL